MNKEIVKEKINLKLAKKLQPNELTVFDKLCLYLLIYSFLGWVIETIYAIYTLGHFVKRGFLLGAVCPIYGFGAVILIIFLSRFKKNSFKLFIISGVILSFFEYLVSYIMSALFAAKWWDYSHEFFNLNGRVSIFYTFCWGVGAILFINHIHPFVEKRMYTLLRRFSLKFQIAGIYIGTGLLLADMIVSIIINFNF